MDFPRGWLLAFSSLLWCIPGFILVRLSILWVLPYGLHTFLVALPVVLLVVVVSFISGFRRIVDRNIERIEGLPQKVAPWQVMSPRGYAMIVTMITLGILLRSSTVPRIWIAGPYAVMGGCLLLGSLRIGHSFFTKRRSSSGGA